MSDPVAGVDPASLVMNLGWLLFGPHFHAAVFTSPLLAVGRLVGWVALGPI